MKSRLEDDDDDEDHGGLVKKIMETKKEYEQTRKTEIVSTYEPCRVKTCLVGFLTRSDTNWAV